MAGSFVPLNSHALPVTDSTVAISSNEPDASSRQAAFETLIHRIHHDLNGPLATISGLVQIARMENKPDQIHTYLDLIQKMSNKLTGILEELVDISHIHQVPINMQRVNLAEEIELVVGSFSEWPEARKVVFEVEAQPEYILTDPGRLKSILSHILSNAIVHHDPDKPKQAIRVISDTDEQEIRIHVIDNGKGIPAEVLPHVFDMFVTGGGDHKGSGLGLYVARESARILKGTISLASRQQEGTTATLCFRRANDFAE